eukprot:1635649-Lingulodinium_polyedra.AAC.1
MAGGIQPDVLGWLAGRATADINLRLRPGTAHLGGKPNLTRTSSPNRGRQEPGRDHGRPMPCGPQRTPA